MNGMSERERIARLETNDMHSAILVSEIKEGLDELNDKVGRIELKFEKSLSFIGGMTFTCSLLGATVTAFIFFLLRKMGIVF